MWEQYLGADADPDGTSPYAAPGRSSDLRGLRPRSLRSMDLAL